MRHAPDRCAARAALRASLLGSAAAVGHPGEVHQAVLWRSGAAGVGWDGVAGALDQRTEKRSLRVSSLKLGSPARRSRNLVAPRPTVPPKLPLPPAAADSPPRNRSSSSRSESDRVA